MKYILWGAGIAVGAIGGYAYWYYVGCLSGSCPITSSPVNSSLYGALMGGLLFNIISPSKNKPQSESSKSDEPEKES